MIYIKTFEGLIKESVKDDLKDFCEINLAYLLDEDYKIMITRRDSMSIINPNHKKGHIIHFYKWQRTFRGTFRLDEVADHFIPFLKRLSNNYTLVQVLIDYDSVNKKLSPDLLLNNDLQDLLKDTIYESLLISRILIIVEEE